MHLSLFYGAALSSTLLHVVIAHPHDAALDLSRKRHHNHAAAVSSSHLGKRAFNNAVFTWYEAGLGACGKTNTDADFIVALTGTQFSQAECFKTITVSYGGKTAQAQIVDLCPTCPYGGLDLSRGLYTFLIPQGPDKVYTASWSYAGEDASAKPSSTPDPKPTPLSTKAPAPPPSTSSSVAPPKTTSTVVASSMSASSSKAASTTLSSSSSSSSTASSGAAVPTSTTTAPSSPEGTLEQMTYALVGMAGMALFTHAQNPRDLF